MLRALTVSLLATALIGGMLYYTFKRSDLLYSQQRDAQASLAAQQEAMAVSRAFAAMSAVALVVDVSRVQEALAGADIVNLITPSATPRAITCLQTTGGTGMTVPSARVTEITADVGQYLPCAANVAIAFASITGAISFAPSTNDGTASSGEPSAFVTPMDAAISVGRHTPVFSSSAMK